MDTHITSLFHSNFTDVGTTIHFNNGACVLMLYVKNFSRLYSDYLYFEKESRKSPANFHWKVVDAIHIFTACFRATSLKSCVYNKIIQQNLQVLPHGCNVG